jgi:hypothetical protein
LALPWRKKTSDTLRRSSPGAAGSRFLIFPLRALVLPACGPNTGPGRFIRGRFFSVCLSTSQDGWLSNEIFLEAAIRTPAPSFLNLLGYIAIFFIYHLFQFRRSLRRFCPFLIDLNVLNVTLPATPVAEPAAY